MPDLMAFQYQMPSGFAGDVTRMTPAAIIEPCAADPTTPPNRLAQAVVIDATSSGARPIFTGDTAAYGVTVRSFPGQAPMASGYYGAAGFGGVVPWLVAGNPQPAVDVLRQGYIMVPVNGATKKGGAVFVWIAADSAPHVRGGFEAASGGASTLALPANTTFNGTPDAFGNVEIAFNI